MIKTWIHVVPNMGKVEETLNSYHRKYASLGFKNFVRTATQIEIKDHKSEFEIRIKVLLYKGEETFRGLKFHTCLVDNMVSLSTEEWDLLSLGKIQDDK